MVARGYWPKILSVREQRARFTWFWPTWKTSLSPRPWSASKQVFVAVGELRPFERGAVYVTRIEYDGLVVPRIWVESPELVRRSDDEEIPHMYDQERICCFMPREDWSGDMTIARYIPPRASQWLFWYELWHATGIWYGGGVHPKRSAPLQRGTKASKDDLGVSRD